MLTPFHPLVHFRFSADADSLVSQKADFELEFGPNYQPTFEILLPINTPEVTLRVQDEGQSVWEHDVDMIGKVLIHLIQQKTIELWSYEDNRYRAAKSVIGASLVKIRRDFTS